MRKLATLCTLAALALSQCQPAYAHDVPERALQYAPILVEAQREHWPDAPYPWYLAGLVEQESCITLRHSKCWNPNVQYRTSREWGRGLGQVTTVWRADGSVRFDKQAELRRQYVSLSGWTSERWADPNYQLTAVVEMNKGTFRRIVGASTVLDHIAFTLSAYNGGLGGVNQDRRLCDNIPGCDPGRWFGHVADHSLKSKRPQSGYSRSFFEINRGHVHNVMHVRMEKYEPFFRAHR